MKESPSGAIIFPTALSPETNDCSEKAALIETAKRQILSLPFAKDRDATFISEFTNEWERKRQRLFFVGIQASFGRWGAESFFLACFQHQSESQTTKASLNLRITKLAESEYLIFLRLLSHQRIEFEKLGGSSGADKKKDILERLTENCLTLKAVERAVGVGGVNPVNLYAIAWTNPS